MFRKIKFRVWDILNERMLNWGDIFHLPAWEIFPGTPEQRAFCVMQYTGLNDKNGKEIYEGDIVTDGTFMYEVIFDRGMYLLKTDGYDEIKLYKMFEDVEIVSNMYEK